jgi:hypothetical protein
MYLLFKSVSQQEQGNVQTIGRVLNYTVGYVPDTHVDILEYNHLNPTILDDNVGKSWMFFGASKNKISVRTGTLQNEQMEILSSAEATGEKVKYDLTPDDQTNALKFCQSVMRKLLDDVYDKRYVQTTVTTNTLEQSTWSQQQKEAELYTSDNTASVPLITSLATARGISVTDMVTKITTAVANHHEKIGNLLAKKQNIEAEIKACESIEDCKRLMHNRFEISMPVPQMKDEGITSSSKFDL